MPDLEQDDRQQDTISQQPTIPPQYAGLSSDVVEDLWQEAVYADPEKNRIESDRRRAAIDALKRSESGTQAEAAAAEVESILRSDEPETTAPSAIPPQYAGLPSSVLEELWQEPTNTDPEKAKAEKAKRRAAIDALRRSEKA